MTDVPRTEVEVDEALLSAAAAVLGTAGAEETVRVALELARSGRWGPVRPERPDRPDVPDPNDPRRPSVPPLPDPGTPYPGLPRPPRRPPNWPPEIR